MNKEMNIYERMSNVENEISNISKDMTVGEGKNSYKAVAEASVLNAIKPLEFKYRIKSLPIKREVISSECYSDDSKGYLKRLFYLLIKVTYRFVNLDNPSDYADIEALGEGTDQLDKGSGKAQTYADKNALLKAYKMISGEDTDIEHSNRYEKEAEQVYTETERIKKNLPDKMLLEANNDQALTRKVMNITLAEFGFKNWKEYNPATVSEVAFMKTFNQILGEQKNNKIEKAGI